MTCKQCQLVTIELRRLNAEIEKLQEAIQGEVMYNDRMDEELRQMEECKTEIVEEE